MLDFLSKLPTPVETLRVSGMEFFLKRDDTIHADFSGNKARKFHYFLAHDFPHIDTVRSYGSNQSNAMYSLSVLARQRGWRFVYTVDHLPEYLRANPHGNFAAALANGMQIRQGSPHHGVAPNCPDSCLWIEEGGRQAEAEYGVRILAEEIHDWQRKSRIKVLDLFLPSGTGTTALYLRKSFSTLEAKDRAVQTCVYTTPCVGDTDYLRRQWAMLEPEMRYHPVVIDLPRKYHFGKPYRAFYEIWIELRQQSGVVFDLLYDPKGWLTLLAHRHRMPHPVMYLHQGGLRGNESMLRRYRRKYPEIDPETGT